MELQWFSEDWSLWNCHQYILCFFLCLLQVPPAAWCFLVRCFAHTHTHLGRTNTLWSIPFLALTFPVFDYEFILGKLDHVQEVMPLSSLLSFGRISETIIPWTLICFFQPSTTMTIDNLDASNPWVFPFLYYFVCLSPRLPYPSFICWWHALCLPSLKWILSVLLHPLLPGLCWLENISVNSSWLFSLHQYLSQKHIFLLFLLEFVFRIEFV